VNQPKPDTTTPISTALYVPSILGEITFNPEMIPTLGLVASALVALPGILRALDVVLRSTIDLVRTTAEFVRACRGLPSATPPPPPAKPPVEPTDNNRA